MLKQNCPSHQLRPRPLEDLMVAAIVTDHRDLGEREPEHTACQGRPAPPLGDREGQDHPDDQEAETEQRPPQVIPVATLHQAGVDHHTPQSSVRGWRCIVGGLEVVVGRRWEGDDLEC